ncbi:ATP-dependent RNA helicase DHX37/DHR1 [Fistulifera solaris]|uniref:RNA helicase n=1 Tax=Fistulifera solaris TaxID=1519565 RepID=A0A1Z5KGC8_FISSO|nr:ATP-dependent RNA helicase DHX37/DHR1 [Fistulifera solaris]|eukprot:GAX25309.1 ATP-dependent RNA helicase DHX37/DHR1 [Fistulifera solaris]
MTEHDKLDEDQEIQKLRNTIKEQDEKISKTSRANRKRKEPEENDSTHAFSGILSEDLIDEKGYNNDGVNLLIVEPKKKKPKQKETVTLTPRELKQAKQLQKNAMRKLKQLETRAQQKEKRIDLYAKLQASALSQQNMELLTSSSTLGKHLTKKEQLKLIVKKERAGIQLTQDEHDLLYRDRDIPACSDQSTLISKSSTGDSKQEKIKPQEQISVTKGMVAGSQTQLQPIIGRAEPITTRQESPETRTNTSQAAASSSKQKSTSGAASSAASFAAQMMASLATLKHKTVTDDGKDSLTKDKELEDILELRKPPVKKYVPSNPVELKTAATLGLHPNKSEDRSKGLKIREIQRPKSVQDARYDLPVATMEFEVMDTIRNNDVTIICGETGSGKSTQVPQFLYEFGFSQSEQDGTFSHPFLIGVTQPRRVAAVSTAKRVSYEMGHGDGISILNGEKGSGNLVSYQTRYETAGLGSSTHIKFMTDGILLQEIQSDLLLRKYNVIILDEAHERGLNTDILIGLLSKAVPLRKEASLESNSALPPLKLVIMSATLRVEDFTGNATLFPSITPAVVKVPGRTHPVTIHHSKVTELVNYEDAMFKKVCKIHRKLPPGGILVFLTGKQDIVQMVKRLRKILCKQSDSRTLGFDDVSPSNASFNCDALRDLDDDEADGDLFRNENDDDYDDVNDEEAPPIGAADESEDGIPKKATILPLYSLLSSEDQAKVFAPVLDGHRLIIIATNIAETSITIPGISYVVDSGRQKCRNFNPLTGVASYDIMWISKAAADQRAGRAGRTGPGHCYRLYSSSMYARHMDDFELPEVLSRPLEDVVLAMKAMHVNEVERFPLPTQPDRSQIKAAIKLLADLGCINTSDEIVEAGDGRITRLGSAVAKLPLGIRCGKMLLVAAQAGVLDYGIAMVAALSEKNPFNQNGQEDVDVEIIDGDDSSSELSEDDNQATTPKKKPNKWTHKAGDVLAVMLAVGAYTYAGKGAGGSSERLACRKFCEENGLNYPIMERIQKMRLHLAGLSKLRLSMADSIASNSGSISYSMPPPTKLQEKLLCQAIASGLLDNIAMLAPVGSMTGQHPFSLRSAYLSCSKSSNEPLFMDRNSVLYSRDSRLLPKWICYESLMRKTLKDGSTISVMKNITPIDPSWLGLIAQGSRLLSVGEPLSTPLPVYDSSKDAIMCCAKTKFGDQGWEVPPVRVAMPQALALHGKNSKSSFLPDDSFRWFGRYLLEGKVIPEMIGLEEMLNESPAAMTRQSLTKKVTLLASRLASGNVHSLGALRNQWATVSKTFLFSELKMWVKEEKRAAAIAFLKTVVQKEIAMLQS